MFEEPFGFFSSLLFPAGIGEVHQNLDEEKGGKKPTFDQQSFKSKNSDEFFSSPLFPAGIAVSKKGISEKTANVLV